MPVPLIALRNAWKIGNDTTITEQEKELLEIIELAKAAEIKLKKMSGFAITMGEKHESWYRAKLSGK